MKHNYVPPGLKHNDPPSLLLLVHACPHCHRRIGPMPAADVVCPHRRRKAGRD